MQARRTRVARGVAAAAVSTFAAAFSHSVAAGEVPSVVALAAASVLAVVVCIAVAGRATPLRVVAGVLVSQAGFHTLFSLAPATTGTAAGTHGSHAMVTLTTAAAAHAHEPADASMWLGHGAAALVTILALLHGERTLAATLDVLRLAVLALLGAIGSLPVLTPAPGMPGWLPAASAGTAVLTSTVRRRGPPDAHRSSCVA